MAGEDTLTAAEEQALARARQKVGTGGSTRTGAKARTTGSGSGSRSGSRPGGGSRGAAKRGGPKGRGASSSGTKRRTTGRGGKRRRRSRRSATLDTARGTAVLLAIALAAAPDPWLPGLLRTSGGVGFGLPDLLPAVFAVLAGAALDHQLSSHRRASGRWWAGRLARRVVVLLAVGLVLAWLAAPDPAALRWTSAYARLGIAGLLGWFVLRDLSRRAQVVLVATWVILAAAADLRGTGLLAGVDARLLGPHALGPVDPDGVVGTLASAVLVVVGAWVGAWLRARPAGPATTVAFGLTATYVGLAGIAWAQLGAVDAAEWTGPTLLLGASLAIAMLAVGHLVELLPSAGRLRWVTATGVVALPVGVAALVAGQLLGVGAEAGTWSHVTTTMVLPVLGPAWGALLTAGVSAVAAARLGAALVDRGWTLRA